MRWFSVATRAYTGSIFAFFTFSLCLVTIVFLNAGNFREQIATIRKDCDDKERLGVSSVLFITATIISLIISIGTFILQQRQSVSQLGPYILQRYEQRDHQPEEVLNNTYQSTLPRMLGRQLGQEQGQVNVGYVQKPTNELQNAGYVGLDG